MIGSCGEREKNSITFAKLKLCYLLYALFTHWRPSFSLSAGGTRMVAASVAKRTSDTAPMRFSALSVSISLASWSASGSVVARRCNAHHPMWHYHLPSPPCRVALTAAMILSWVAMVGILSTTWRTACCTTPQRRTQDTLEKKSPSKPRRWGKEGER